MHTPQYYLTSDARCLDLGEGAVILDLRSGTYLGINAEFLATLRHEVANWPSYSALSTPPVDCYSLSVTHLLNELASKRIINRLPAKNAVDIVTPTKAARWHSIGTAPLRVKIVHAVRFLSALLHVIVWCRSNQIAPYLRKLHRMHMELNVGQSRDCLNPMYILSSFFRLRVWFYTAQNRCLFDSMVLALYLIKSGLRCNLVVAVSNRPFLAHAWIQAGDTVLNDTTENVAAFTPILCSDTER